jgi:alkyl-hydroperoxide reductase/thiol specific antioxidant family protein
MTIADLLQTHMAAIVANGSKTESPALDCSYQAPVGEAPTDNDLPSADVISKLNEVTLFDEKGASHSFKTIYAADDVDRHLILIVRHFFCTNCQIFLRHLSKELPPSSLPPRTRITVISNGTPELLSNYIKNSNSAYPTYTNPDRKLYELLGLASTKAMGAKPSYMKESLATVAIQGVVQGLSSGKHMLKGGDFWQVGGEFLFVREGEDWKITWGHRMKTTRDHEDADTLKSVLGMSSSEKKDAPLAST